MYTVVNLKNKFERSYKLYVFRLNLRLWTKIKVLKRIKAWTVKNKHEYAGKNELWDYILFIL